MSDRPEGRCVLKNRPQRRRATGAGVHFDDTQAIQSVSTIRLSPKPTPDPFHVPSRPSTCIGAGFIGNVGLPLISKARSRNAAWRLGCQGATRKVSAESHVSRRRTAVMDTTDAVHLVRKSLSI